MRERGAKQLEEDDDVEDFLERIRSEIEKHDEKKEAEHGGDILEIRKEQWEAQQRKMRKIDTEERPDLAGEIHRVANPRNAGDERWELTPPFMRPVDRALDRRKTPEVRRPRTELPKLAKRLGGGVIEDKTNLYPIPVKYINNFPCYSRRQLNDLNHLLQKNILSPWLSSEITPIIRDGNVVEFLGGPPWFIWEDIIEGAIKYSNVEPAVIRKDFDIPGDVVDVAGYLGKLRDTAEGGLTRFYIEREYTRSNIPLKVREGVAKKRIIIEAPRSFAPNIQFRRWKQSVWEWDSSNAKWKSAIKEALRELQSILLMNKLNSKAFIQKRNELTVHLEGIRNRLEPLDDSVRGGTSNAGVKIIRKVYDGDLANNVIKWNGFLHNRSVNNLIKENVTITESAKEMIKNPNNFFKKIKIFYYKKILEVYTPHSPNEVQSIKSVVDNTVYIAPILKNMRSYGHVLNGSKVTITISDVVAYLGDSYFQFCDYKYGVHELPTKEGVLVYLGDNCTYSEVPTQKYIFEGSYYVAGPDLHAEIISTRGARRLALLLGVDISQIPPCFSVPVEARAARVAAPITKEDVMLYFQRDGRRVDKEDLNRNKKYRQALLSILNNKKVLDASISKPILNHLVEKMNTYETNGEKKLYIDTISVPSYFNNQKQAQLERIISNFNELFEADGLTFESFINVN